MLYPGQSVRRLGCWCYSWGLQALMTGVVATALIGACHSDDIPPDVLKRDFFTPWFAYLGAMCAGKPLP